MTTQTAPIPPSFAAADEATLRRLIAGGKRSEATFTQRLRGKFAWMELNRRGLAR